MANSLPTDDAQRGQYPMADGLLDYFPNALAEVSRISYEGSLKHNVGQPMHWARGKSTDHRNKIIRHTIDAVQEDEAGIEHAAQAAWRALACLQEKIERVRGVPVSAGSRTAEEPAPTGWRCVGHDVRDCTFGKVYPYHDGDRTKIKDDVGDIRPVNFMASYFEPA